MSIIYLACAVASGYIAGASFAAGNYFDALLAGVLTQVLAVAFISEV
jgi:hypothetical protein